MCKKARVLFCAPNSSLFVPGPYITKLLGIGLFYFILYRVSLLHLEVGITIALHIFKSLSVRKVGRNLDFS